MKRVVSIDPVLGYRLLNNANWPGVEPALWPYCRTRAVSDCLEMGQSTGSILTGNGGLPHNRWCDAG